MVRDLPKVTRSDTLLPNPMLCLFPRHVPAAIISDEAIAYTLTVKKMEGPVRKLLVGAAIDAVQPRRHGQSCCARLVRRSCRRDPGVAARVALRRAWPTRARRIQSCPARPESDSSRFHKPYR